MLNEMAISLLLVFSVAPPPATAREDVGRVRQDHQAKRMNVAPVSPQHGALMAVPEGTPPAQKQSEHTRRGMTWYRQPQPRLRNLQAGPHGGGLKPELPLEQRYGQDNVHDKSDYGGQDDNRATARKLVRT